MMDVLTPISQFLTILLVTSAIINAAAVTRNRPKVNSIQNLRQFKGSSVLDEVPLVDGHNDLPMNIYSVVNNHLDKVDLRKNLSEDAVWRQVETSQTDIPRLRAGKVGGQFWVAYTPCRGLDKDAAELTFDQIDVIKRMINKYSDVFQYTTSSTGIWDAFEKGKIASLIAVEGGHSMDNRLGVLRLFYEMGVRYMTLTHTCNLPWVYASPIDDQVATKYNLTDWGRKVVTEMNRLGMMVDISHVSKGVMLDVLNTTQAPVIFSHSNSWTIHKHHRNVQDDVLLELKKKHGIIMVNFYPYFLGGASMSKVIEHLNYIRRLIGTDHIGIGGDFDGIEEVPTDLADVSYYPALFDRLAESSHSYEPWTENDLKKLAGLNLIRVMRQVEAVRDSLKNVAPIDDYIPFSDLIRYNPTQGCRTDLDKYRD